MMTQPTLTYAHYPNEEVRRWDMVVRNGRLRRRLKQYAVERAAMLDSTTVEALKWLKKHTPNGDRILTVKPDNAPAQERIIWILQMDAKSAWVLDSEGVRYYVKRRLLRSAKTTQVTSSQLCDQAMLHFDVAAQHELMSENLSSHCKQIEDLILHTRNRCV